VLVTQRVREHNAYRTMKSFFDAHLNNRINFLKCCITRAKGNFLCSVLKIRCINVYNFSRPEERLSRE